MSKINAVDEIKATGFDQAMIEITDYCNFKCIHCYNDDSHCQRAFIEIKNNIDALYDLGVNKISLTGGEVLVHPDFEIIYRYLCDKKFEITLFTNGSNILKFEKLWLELPPRQFSISLYGVNDNMYDKFTQTKNMFQKVKASLDFLFEHNIPFELKTIVTKKNIAEVLDGKYTLFANEYNTSIRYGMELFETEAHNGIICDLRLDIDEMLAFMDLTVNEKRRKRYYECAEYNPIYQECNAGRKSLAVNSKGEYCICLRDLNYGFVSDNIEIIREKLMRRKDELDEINRQRVCAGCKANDICNGICSLEPSMPGSKICEFHHEMMKRISGETTNV